MWQNETERDNKQLFPPQPDLKDVFRYREEKRAMPVSPVLKCQILLCSALLLVVLGARQVGLPAYAEMKEAYRQVLARDMNLAKEQELLTLAGEMLLEFEARAEEAAAYLKKKFEAEAPATERNVAEAPEGEWAAWEGFYLKKLPEGCSLKCYMPKGEMLSPLAWYTVSSPYGWRKDPFTGRKGDFHKGIDLAAAEGTPILAAAEGVTEAVLADVQGGNWVKLRHKEGVSTRYCHMQYVFVHPGETVAAGQKIGTVGQTGKVTGPHLHWELMHENTLYDPSQALGQAALL
ncbi:MAG: M23 family metallopeptidase [Oscillospiraceae bacterium]|nr:M23 family metallopeptidase [Oscillospiraceae bacterium]